MSRLHFHSTISIILHFYIYGWASGLRDVRIWVPEAVLSGNSVKLACDYDLEQAALYSIKWYRGDEEFYRYVPKEAPPTRVFPLPGMHVDIDYSDAREVTLIDVQRQLSGLYKCEVSADAPLFHTDIKSANMTVVVIPGSEPTLAADKRRYSAGEQIHANCTSLASYPPANITWFVNGKQVAGQSTGVVLLEPGRGSLATTRSSLELEVDAATFPASKLRLRCVATLFNIYQRSSEELELQEDQPQIASVRRQNIAGSSPSPQLSLALIINTFITLAINRR